jgi:hypothetical protein
MESQIPEISTVVQVKIEKCDDDIILCSEPFSIPADIFNQLDVNLHTIANKKEDEKNVESVDTAKIHNIFEEGFQLNQYYDEIVNLQNKKYKNQENMSINL